jgi:GNAT superfamily N-acetyltransferase
MPGALTIATADQASAVAALRNAVADQLTRRHGVGHWSSVSSEKGVRGDMRRSSVYLWREKGLAIGTLQLATRKPWAIDRRYFTPVKRPLYLLGMAVDPAHQGTGVGRRCIDHAVAICRTWPADALCLDAYDADAGAGGFYRRCGFTEVGRATYRYTPLIYFEMLVDT